MPHAGAGYTPMQASCPLSIDRFPRFTCSNSCRGRDKNCYRLGWSRGARRSHLRPLTEEERDWIGGCGGRQEGPRQACAARQGRLALPPGRVLLAQPMAGRSPNCPQRTIKRQDAASALAPIRRTWLRLQAGHANLVMIFGPGRVTVGLPPSGRHDPARATAPSTIHARRIPIERLSHRAAAVARGGGVGLGR